MLGLSKDEYRSLIVSVGTHRGERKLSPTEVASLVRKALTAGVSRSQVAENLQVSSTQLSTFLKLLDLEVGIQHLADWRGSKGATVSFSSLAELTRIRQPAEQVEAATAILRHRLTWKEVIQLVQIWDRSEKTIKVCLEEVLKLRPRVEMYHVFFGTIESEELQKVVPRLSQVERDGLLKRAIRKLLGKNDLVKTRLGVDSFTCMSEQNLPKLLGCTPDQLSDSINELLLESQS